MSSKWPQQNGTENKDDPKKMAPIKIVYSWSKKKYARNRKNLFKKKTFVIEEESPAKNTSTRTSFWL